MWSWRSERLTRCSESLFREVAEEVGCEGIGYVAECRCNSSLECNRGDSFGDEAAGVDESEPIEIGGDVEGEAMHGDSVGNFDSNGTYFPLSGCSYATPHSGGILDTTGLNTEVGTCVDNRLLEAADVGFHSETAVAESQDRIGDELPRTVESDVATALHTQDFGSALT